MIKRLLLFCLLFLASLPVWAVTYTFSSGGFLNPHSPPPCQGGVWQARSGDTFTCTGRIVLAAGDELRVSTYWLEGLGNIRVVALNGFSLINNSIGTAAKNITLESSYGSIDAIGSNSIQGSVLSASGGISLSGTTVSAAVSGTGAVILANSQIGGSVSGQDGVTSTNSQIQGSLTASNGAINLTGGQVNGLVTSNCCTLTSNGSNLLGGANANSGLNISGGTLSGNFAANSNPALFSGVTLSSGSVTGSSATFTDSQLGAPDSPVTVTTQSGAVTLNNSEAFGNFTAPHNSTIFVNSPSSVTGTCLPNSTPANACQPAAPPTCFIDDSFERDNLGVDWVTTRRNGTFNIGIANNSGRRLRLTNDSAEVATAATLQWLLPAARNLVTIEFDYFAYSNSASRGADGIAVILSDGSVTPQPGSFGGSLGYAQRDNGAPGFAGGWLGIGLDEYGNFAKPTEGRNGGPGVRRDSITLRGSQAGAYRYLEGTGTLDPEVDSNIASSSARPGHRYRIVVDSRVSGQAMVSVARRTSSGGSFQTLVAPFNALASAGQGSIPSDFLLSFTGATGSRVNIHELDNLQVCAVRYRPVGPQIDHFRFSHASSSLTCNPLEVTLRACLNATCSQLYSDPVTVELSPSALWVGGNPLTFTGGVTTLQLRGNTPGTVTLGVNSSTPPARAFGTNLCSTADCRVSFVESGFIIDAPDVLAGKPASATVRAVRADPSNPQACVPGFVGGSRTLQWRAGYIEPNSGSQPVLLNGTPLSSSYTPLSVTFDSSASASLPLRYDDAGQMRLEARYAPSSGDEAGLVMTGEDSFVSRPYGLCLQTASSCAEGSDYSACPVMPGGVRAGDAFDLDLRAVAWRRDGQPLTADELCGNPTTANFRLGDIALSHQLLAPTAGVPGTLSLDRYSHVLGESTRVRPALSEVGVFRLTASPPSYFGQPINGGSSAPLGRLPPAWLEAQGSAALQAACTAFSYQGQAMGFAQPPQLEVLARNRQGQVTANYDRPGFWRLALPARASQASGLPYLSVVSEAGRNPFASAQPGADLNTRLQVQGSVLSSVDNATLGDGRRTFRWTGESLLYAPAAAPQSEDLPFTASVQMEFAAAALQDSDGVCQGVGGSCSGYTFSFAGTEVRLGRLQIGNAHGSELQSLSLPLQLQSWQSQAGRNLFLAENADSCSNALLQTAELGPYTGNLEGHTQASLGWPLAAQGSLLLSAPGAGNQGSVLARLRDTPAWLWFDWRGAGREPASGLASFGIHRGSAPLIYRRELYRTQ